MANEYKCDICGKPATVHITKIIDDKKVKIHLCSDCAAKASVDPIVLSPESLPKIKDIVNDILESKNVKADTCPSCGAELAEIEKGARFSCPACYAALGNRLFELFAQMHAATTHNGKSPKFHAPNCAAKIDLNKKLRDFEEIAGGELFDEDLENSLAEFMKSEPVKIKATVVDSPESAEAIQKQLSSAISEERYEDAAKLRDKLKFLSEHEK